MPLKREEKLEAVAAARDDILFFADDALPEHRLMPILAKLTEALGFPLLSEEIDNLDGVLWWGDSPDE